MDLPTLDLLLRGATFGVAVAAAVAILARRRPGWPAPLAAFAVAGIGAFVVASLPGGILTFGLALFGFTAWCIATPGVVWLLAGTLFRDDFRPGPWHLAVVGTMTIVTFAGDWGRFRLGPLAADPELASWLFVAGRATALVLLAAASAFAVAHWRADLVESRRRARAVFVGMIGAVFAALAASDFVFGPAGPGLVWLALGHVALLGVAFATLQVVARGGLDELLSAPEPVAQVPRLAVIGPDDGPGVAARPILAARRSDNAEIVLARRVTTAMETDRLWKREGLGIADLARELGTQEYLLRRAINRRLGYRNFNEFLHRYRLDEIARRLGDPAERHLPVLTIALDCGYGSIGPFNRAFKARFGVTPSQFRELRAKDIAVSEIGRIPAEIGKP
jgi:AraC-like DNA-binding protein